MERERERGGRERGGGREREFISFFGDGILLIFNFYYCNYIIKGFL